jgi:hypothetical protein
MVFEYLPSLYCRWASGIVPSGLSADVQDHAFYLSGPVDLKFLRNLSSCKQNVVGHFGWLKPQTEYKSMLFRFAGIHSLVETSHTATP